MDEVQAYDYELPKELIAQHPLPNRSDSRMLIVDRAAGTIDHAHVRDLPEILAPGDSLVLNDSRVVPARLVGRRTLTGGRWQGLFLSADEHGNWRMLCKTRGNLKPGDEIEVFDRAADPALRLRMLTRLDGGEWAAHVERLGPQDGCGAAAGGAGKAALEEAAGPLSQAATWRILDQIGRVPVPPYIRGGEMEPGDLERYQTVYANAPGSVAAPTAGLHMSKPLLDKLQSRGIDPYFVTLHVGIGTFRPMNAGSLADHRMHSEAGELSSEVARRLLQTREAGGRVVAVGTTSVRVLESAAAQQGLRGWSGSTELFIKPPYRFQAVDALMTNFHLPKSTLLVLVRTFGGDGLIRRAYEEAIDQRYRFFSYGDAMLIL